MGCMRHEGHKLAFIPGMQRSKFLKLQPCNHARTVLELCSFRRAELMT